MGEIATLRKKRSRDFTTLSNELLRDSRLSWKARGLFCYLWSHSDNFKFSVERLTSKAADGRDSTASGLAELQRLGYLVIERIRGSGGRFVRVTWTLSEDPIASVQLAPSPEPENPDVEADHKRETGIPVETPRTTEELSVRRTTTTTPALQVAPPSPEDAQAVVVQKEVQSERQLIQPTRLSPTEGEHAVAMVLGRVSVGELAQQLLDELDAKLEAKQIQKPWPCYLDGLIRRALTGQFRFAAGMAIEERRANRLVEIERTALRAAERSRRKAADPGIARAHLEEIRASLKPHAVRSAGPLKDLQGAS